MKPIFTRSLLAVAVSALLAPAAFAQTSESGSNSISGSNSGSNSTATSQAGNGWSSNQNNSLARSSSNSSTASTAMSGVSSQGQALNNTVSISLASPTNSDGSSGAASKATTGTNAAVGTTNTDQVNYSGNYSIKTTPPVAAPNLTTTLSDTCMGSVSLGFSLTGFGFSGGSTMVDQACVRRLDAREFRAMGMNDVAVALLCQSEANRRAVESAGHTCPGSKPLAENGQPAELAERAVSMPVSERASNDSGEPKEPRLTMASGPAWMQPNRGQ